MADFGYGLTPGKGINLDDCNSDLFQKIVERSPDILKCIACGSCTSTCSGSIFSRVSFRRSILLLERGENREALNTLKGCMLCGKCFIICPRGINTRDIILTVNQYYKKELL
ncbi:MAG: 4Fe-4S dicluster domain-containing protein [Bacteroidales bacterium]|jgi:heterodisulfide reductase subunit C|nr:4Fe-4S dicluster domain-containing protein [Bacteroidales bacterium]